MTTLPWPFSITSPAEHDEAVAQPVPAVRAERGIWWRDAVAIGLMLLLQAVYFTGVVGSDDLGYASLIWHSRGGEPVPWELSYYFARFVHWKLIHLAVVLVPGTPAAIALPSMVASLVTLLAVRHLAVRYVDARLGWLAVLLYGLVPVSVLMASAALPDTVATALGWGGVCLAAGPILEPRGRGDRWRCLLAGLLIAVGYNAKETIAALIPCLGMFVGLRWLIDRLRGRLTAHGRYGRQRKAEGVGTAHAAESALATESPVTGRQSPAKNTCGNELPHFSSRIAHHASLAPALALAAGGMIWLVAETVIFWLWTGDPGYHGKAIAWSQAQFTGPPIGPGLSGLIAYWSEYIRWLLEPAGDLGIMGPALLVGLIASLFDRRPAVRLLLCLVVPSFVYLSAGSTSIRNYDPVIHQPRYLLPILPGMALLATAQAVRLIRWGRVSPLGYVLRGTAGIAFALAALTSLAAPDRLAGRWYHAATFSAGVELFRDHLPEGGKVRLVGSQLTANRFDQLHHWLDMPPVEPILPLPETAAEWSHRYAGAILVISRQDRVQPSKAKYIPLSLFGSDLTEIRGLELLARTAPPRSRLESLQAGLTGGRAEVDDDHAVELWRIPAREAD